MGAQSSNTWQQLASTKKIVGSAIRGWIWIYGKCGDKRVPAKDEVFRRYSHSEDFNVL